MRVDLWMTGLVAIIIAAGAPLHASTGGPQYAELMGWDAKDQKVFFSLVGMNESGLAPTVVYLKVDGPETIGLLSFRTIPHEEGYEIQIPVLLSKPRQTPPSGPRPVRRIESVLP